MTIELKSAAKALLAKTKYRVTNANRHWGLDPLDDIEKIVGDTRKVQVIYDVGANHGQSALRYAKFFPNAAITSFEPISTTFSKLLANTKSCDRIEAINLALGNVVGAAEATLFGDSGKSSLVGAMTDTMHDTAAGSETVQQTTLDDFLSQSSAAHIDFFKTDTEGYDLEVLKGAEKTLRRSGITFVLSEFHYLFEQPGDHTLGSLQEISTFLAKFRYRFISCYTDSVHCNEPLGTYNALFMPEKHLFEFLP